MDTRTLRQIIVPSRGQVITCLVLALVVLVGVNWSLLLALVAPPDFTTDPYFKQAYEQQLEMLGNIRFLNIFVVVAFWSGIYLVVYTIFWIVMNSFIEARNDVVIETSYVNKGSANRRLKTFSIQIGMALVGLAYLTGAAATVVPVWLEFFSGAIQNPAEPASLALGAASVVGLGATIYIGWTLVEMTLAASRLFR